MTHLCVAIFVTELAKAKREIALAAEAGADMVELRVDRFTEPAQVQELVRSSILPCIVTCRPVWEGGQCELGDVERLAILDAAGQSQAGYIDVELETTRRGLQLPGWRTIVSSHDFTGRPDRLYNLLHELNSSSADVVKIVWAARTIRDNLEAFEVLKTRQKPTIALCMGEAGLISRILANKFGAFLTFAAPNSSTGTAPGQIAVGEMKSLYRWDAINEKTRVYGVVGQPVMHSMSPAIHNGAFEAIGYDGVYLPLLVEASYESFKAFMETFVAFEGLDLSGLSVTIPHKQNALRYLQSKGAEVEPLAQAIGSVNTILIDRDSGTPRLRGMNTDYAAILDSITAKLDISRAELAKYRVAVLGAGGTGRTAVAGLAHYGASVVVYNRTLDRAEELAREFNGRSGQVTAASLEQIGQTDCSIIINTTSVGMHPKVEASPLGENPQGLTKDSLVFDCVYNPMKTKLLAQAEAAGARTISGVEMFVRQAVAQFEAWTHKPAPVAVMRQIVEHRLSR
ncbi:MAG TPA: shikimate dehydrogenase [Tepidisphaeraceae bacterium]|nr:shikimate dehydrogenase [Tepidisphaeraceae bacterium]